MTPQELDAYESYWKAVSSERSLISDSATKAELKTRREIALSLKTQGFPIEVIASSTGLSQKEVEGL